MDVRWTRLLVGGLLCGALGCSTFGGKKPVSPNSTGEPPLGLVSMKPVEEKKGKEGPVGPDFLAAYAATLVQASMDENKSSAERAELQNQARSDYQKALSREP